MVKTGQTGGIDVFFGNGFNGKVPDLGSTILIEYLITDGEAGNIDEIFITESNTIRHESLSALVALGFMRKNAEKVVGNLIAKQPGLTVEEVIKQALKLL